MRHRGSASLQVGGELGRRWEGTGRQGVEDEASCKRKYADEGGGRGEGGRERGGGGGKRHRSDEASRKRKLAGGRGAGKQVGGEKGGRRGGKGIR